MQDALEPKVTTAASGKAGAGRGSHFLRDAAAMLSSRIGSAALAFISGIVVARALGVENRGLIAAIITVPIVVINFADLGLRQSTTYFVGKKLHDDQTVLSTLALLSMLTTFIGVVLSVCFFLASGTPQRYGWTPILWALCVIPANLVSIYAYGFLLGKGHIREISVSALLTGLSYLFLLLVLLIPGLLPRSWGASWALAATFVSNAVSALYLLRLTRRYGQWRPKVIAGLPAEFIGRGFQYALAMFVLGMIHRADVVILERLADARQVGIYAAGVALAEIIWMLPAALAQVVFSRSAAAADEYEQARKTALVMRLALFASLPACAALYIVAPYVLPLLYGRDFSSSGAVVRALLPGIWVNLIFKVLNGDLAGRGRPLLAFWVFGVGLALNVVLNIVFIPRYGALGSAWASSVSYCASALAFSAVYARTSRLSLWELFLPRRSDLAVLRGAGRRNAAS